MKIGDGEGESMTKTYYDLYTQTDFEANVIECVEDEGSYLIELDETCFYSEGGGQPSDKGTLNGLEVSEVLWRNGHLYHRVSGQLEGKIEGKVDFAWREEQAQIHSAMHLISGEVNRLLHGPTLSIHAGEEVNELIYDLSEYNEETHTWLQEHVNTLLKQDLPIHISYPTHEEALKITSDESKIDHENLRLVCIGERDFNFCGCIHVQHLMQIQMIQLTSYSITKGHLHLYFTCGTQLQRYLKKRIAVLDEVAAVLGYSHLEIKQGIQDKMNTIKEKEAQLTRIKELWIEELHNRLVNQEIIIEEFEDMEVKEAQMLSGMLCKKDSICLGFIVHNGERAHVLLAQGKASNKDLRGIFKMLSTQFDLRGGGNPYCVQGGCSYSDALKVAVEKVLK